MSDVDRLVEIIAERVKERLSSQQHPAAAAAKLALIPRDRGECNDDSSPGEDCAGCGACVDELRDRLNAKGANSCSRDCSNDLVSVRSRA